MRRPDIPAGELRRVLLFLLLMLAVQECLRAQQLPARLYTSADGLTSSAGVYMARDSRGFLWFCTRDGLSRFDGYDFTNYKISDDPATQNVRAIVESRTGAYWISTDGGLFRVQPEGATARVAPTSATTPEDTRSLKAEKISSSSVRVLFEDRTGNVWGGGARLWLIAAPDGRVLMQTVELRGKSQGEQGPSVQAITEGPEGSLWLGCATSVIRRFPDGQTLRYDLPPASAADDTVSLQVDDAGRVWVARKAGLFVFLPEPLEAVTGRANPVSRALSPHGVQLISRDGPAALPSQAGDVAQINFVAPNSPGPDSRSRLSATTDLHRTADGRLWIAAGGLLLSFDGKEFKFFSSLKNHFVVTLAEDLNGDLWVGTTAGVLRLSLEGLITYNEGDGIVGSTVHAISEDAGGNLYVVSGDWSIDRFNSTSFSSAQLSLPPSAKRVWISTVALRDGVGRWWAMTDSGLFRFAANDDLASLSRQQPATSFGFNNGLKGEEIFRTFMDQRGDLWISTHGKAEERGVTRWDHATNSFHAFTPSDGWPAGKSAASFAEDRSGVLWFGLYEGGLARFVAGRFELLKPEDGAPAGGVFDLHLDQKGRLWLASTTEGLFRIDDPQATHLVFRRYTTSDGLASNNVRCLTEDLQGRLYAGSVSGIDRLSPDSGRIKHYSVASGLGADFVRVAYRDHRGELWFGTTNGVSRLNPEPDRTEIAPPIQVSGLKIAGIRYAISEFGSAQVGDIELGPAQNNLQISFRSLDIGRTDNLRYQYRLEGADTDWTAATAERTVSYARLAPGSYRFLVRAMSGDGAVSAQPATISFRILPPVWRRWWFIALVALFVLSGTFSLVRYRASRVRERRDAEDALLRSREERLRELERVRKRIASDLHDEIGSSLTQISLLSEVIQQRTDGKDSTLTSPLATIATSSRELVDSMSDIVWAINPQKDHLRDLVQRMRSLASEVFTISEVKFRFRAPGGDADVPLGANLRREVFLVYKESINNIVKHAKATSADVELRLEADRLVLKVSDDGQGFDATKQSDGHGLLSMRDRARGMGATFELESAAGKGATVTLQVPLTDAAFAEQDEKER